MVAAEEARPPSMGEVEEGAAEEGEGEGAGDRRQSQEEEAGEAVAEEVAAEGAEAPIRPSHLRRPQAAAALQARGQSRRSASAELPRRR